MAIERRYRLAGALFATLLLIAACTATDGDPAPGTPGASPSDDATPVTDSAASTPSAGPFGAATFGQPDSCEDDSVGYRVAVPDAWWWNQPFDSEIGPHAQCRYFAPDFFDAGTVSREQPIPEGVAISVLVIPPGAGVGGSGELVSSEEITVAGQPATRIEEEHEPGGVLEPGERLYRYVIELSQERRLVFATGNAIGDYGENRDVLDRMMETLECSIRARSAVRTATSSSAARSSSA